MAAFHSPDWATATSASASSAVPEGGHERAKEPKLAAPARNITKHGNVHKSFCQVHRPSLLLPVARYQIFALPRKSGDPETVPATIGATT